MDTSETYIKMCEKAEEIQAHRGKDQIGNESYSYADGKIFLGCGTLGSALAESAYKSDEIVWLPRQDQLQDMVGGFSAGFVNWSGWLDNIYPEHGNPFSKTWRFASMEQLWLAFVMKENFQKIWNGAEWAVG